MKWQMDLTLRLGTGWEYQLVEEREDVGW